MKKILSISDILRRRGKSSQEFEMMVSSLTLEELIALKLELSINFLKSKRFVGFPIWNSIGNITKDALLRFALAQGVSYKHCASILGITEQKFYQMIKKYKTENYFEENTFTEK